MDRKSQNDEIKALLGLKFGRLEIISAVRGSNRKGYVVQGRCGCGTVRQFVFSEILSGRRKSCGQSGCRGRHRMSHSSEYRIWASMIDRCYNPRNTSYARYGGRGISVCSQWRESFEAFYADVGPRPSMNYSIDRYPNNNGNYEPGNVRWATRQDQANNMRTNRIVEIDGHKLSVSQWSALTGVHHAVIFSRLDKGWNPKSAVLTPPISPRRNLITGRFEAHFVA